MAKLEERTPLLTPVIYLGEEVDVLGDIRQRFRNAQGETFMFAGVRGIFPGDTVGYDAAAKSMRVRPKIIVEGALELTEKEHREMAVNRELVKYARLRKQKGRKALATHPDIAKALSLLRPFVKDLDMMNLRRFSEALVNELSRSRKDDQK